MSYNVIAVPNFLRNLKKLAKRYPSIKTDFSEFLESLKHNPEQGACIVKNCYKVRMTISSKGRGKSGGARVITCLQVHEETIYLLSVYDKSDKENISDKELKELLKQIEMN